VKEELARSDEEYTRLKASGQIVEIKLVSSGVGLGADVRYNLMKLNSVRDFDPTTIPPPILLNRKQPGPRAPPTFALDDEGNILGRYVYDEKGHPVMGSDGKQVIDVKEKADTSLIGGEAGKRKARKGVKDVFHQDKEVMRLRREEAVPWVLESGRAVGEANGDGSADAHGSNGAPEHWVGRLVEAAAMPTVLLVNDGAGDGFRVWPLGRTYRFEPERPFKVLDPDAAHKLVRRACLVRIILGVAC
jgi:transcription initiation factor TFIIF subunit alpha